MATFSLSDSLDVRKKLTQAQYKRIQKLYQQMASVAAKEAEKLKGSTNSGKLQEAELKKLAKQLQKEAQRLGVSLEGAIKSNMSDTSSAVVADAIKFNGKLGVSIEGAYSRVPTDIVEVLTSGKLYGGKWSLSKAIWSDIKKTQDDISTVVAGGIALNKSSYDIAKDLEMYVDPSAKKPWDWSKVYPGTKKQIDYNAQRLARTMVGHAYQQSVVSVAKNDPFVEGVRWISGHSSTNCELCKERNGKIFPVGKLPLDHPNGKCSFAPVIRRNMTDIADELADWANGKPNKSLDSWFKKAYGASHFTVEAKPKTKTASKPSTPAVPTSKWSSMRKVQPQNTKSLKDELKKFGISEKEWYLLRDEPDSIWGSAYHYVSNSGPYNKTLRGKKVSKVDKYWIEQSLKGRTHEEMIQDVIKGIDKAIDEYTVESPFVVTRTVAHDFASKKFKIGATFVEDGYTSTTMGEPKELGITSFGAKKKGDVTVLPDRIEILVNSGKGVGVPLGQVTPGGDKDREFLIKHGTEYEIIGRRDDGTWLMIMKS